MRKLMIGFAFIAVFAGGLLSGLWTSVEGSRDRIFRTSFGIAGLTRGVVSALRAGNHGLASKQAANELYTALNSLRAIYPDLPPDKKMQVQRLLVLSQDQGVLEEGGIEPIRSEVNEWAFQVISDTPPELRERFLAANADQG